MWHAHLIPFLLSLYKLQLCDNCGKIESNFFVAENQQVTYKKNLQKITRLLQECGLLVGIVLGASMGALACGVGALYGAGLAIAAILGLSMVAIVLVANSFGALLPFILSRFRIDPAVASSPLVTSVMDVLGLIIYFAVAVLILA